MKKAVERNLKALWSMILALGIAVSASPVWAATNELDTAIDSGFGKLVKYGRWTAALVLAVVFVLAWAERGQNPDNPHESQRASRKMLWAGVGFVVVIGYKLVLTGLVQWFNLDPSSIPAFLWQ